MSIAFSSVNRLLLRHICSFPRRSKYLCSLLPTWDQYLFHDGCNSKTQKRNLLPNNLKCFSSRSNLIHISRQHSTNAPDKRVDKVFTVPNILTFSRLLSAPVITYCVVNDTYPFALCLFVAAGVTDVLDGFIARNWKGQSSVLGSIIDPLADKVLVVCLSVSLAYANLLPVWLVSLILLRDFSLITGAAYLRFLSLPYPKTARKFVDPTLPTIEIRPSYISKFNTFVQLALITATLSSPVFGFIDHPYLHYLWYLTAATTVLSGTDYLMFRNCFTFIEKQLPKK